CNYDGYQKHQTIIEEGVFMGSNTALVAPVKIGKGALVGAGSTITKDVPPYALAVGRAKQKNIKKWVIKRNKKNR
ncbi:MAG: bifunctional UDP-N-acetylglucosamine diphosphorylase/glucosamine-1-phosphate N-acetyltransferase GlmU, partial [Deltaproteobacteria bacterium]|nr:bifunctional UDP-N-acetylglucosamine diphosphorylase/glucosamine-1-phosphate N-acetyltransferase GlmU [Deltaproteobacteria bacterium]